MVLAVEHSRIRILPACLKDNGDIHIVIHGAPQSWVQPFKSLQGCFEITVQYFNNIGSNWIEITLPKHINQARAIRALDNYMRLDHHEVTGSLAQATEGMIPAADGSRRSHAVGLKVQRDNRLVSYRQGNTKERNVFLRIYREDDDSPSR